MSKPKINCPLFIVIALAVIAIMGFSNLTKLTVQGYPIDVIAGFVILTGICGVSVYRNVIPGLLATAVWCLVGQFNCVDALCVFGKFYIVLAAMGSYALLIRKQPESPHNVYFGAAAGATVMFIIRTLFSHVLTLAALVEFAAIIIVTLMLIKKLREVHLINHEDPERVIDSLQLIYNRINRRYGTNLKRPVRPNTNKEEKSC